MPEKRREPSPLRSGRKPGKDDSAKGGKAHGRTQKKKAGNDEANGKKQASPSPVFSRARNRAGALRRIKAGALPRIPNTTPAIPPAEKNKAPDRHIQREKRAKNDKPKVAFPTYSCGVF